MRRMSSSRLASMRRVWRASSPRVGAVISVRRRITHVTWAGTGPPVAGSRRYSLGVTIRITRREGGVPTCPYCLDAVPLGPECPGCATRYHDECAATFGRCATLGCKAPLDQGPRPTGRALPRLAAIAARLAGSASPAPWLDDDEGQSFLALVPSPGHAARGAEVLAELLGQTVYDARLRLSSGLPEPLLRLPTAADAE